MLIVLILIGKLGHSLLQFCIKEWVYIVQIRLHEILSMILAIVSHITYICIRCHVVLISLLLNNLRGVINFYILSRAIFFKSSLLTFLYVFLCDAFCTFLNPIVLRILFRFSCLFVFFDTLFGLVKFSRHMFFLQILCLHFAVFILWVI